MKVQYYEKIMLIMQKKSVMPLYYINQASSPSDLRKNGYSENGSFVVTVSDI